jgi:transposase
VPILPWREPLADRQAAAAVRARIARTYLRGLALTDPGCDFSGLSACRAHLLAGRAAAVLLEELLERCRGLGLLKPRGQQRIDSTHVRAAIGTLRRLTRVAETWRAARNDRATLAPAWRQRVAPLAWDER